jgi:hypothetical protein
MYGCTDVLGTPLVRKIIEKKEKRIIKQMKMNKKGER